MPSEEEYERQRKLEEGWEHELDEQAKREGSSYTRRKPDDEDGCIKPAVEIILLIFFIFKTVYQTL